MIFGGGPILMWSCKAVSMSAHSIPEIPIHLMCTLDMLQRLYWHGAKSTVKIEKARKRVNAAARSSFLREGGDYIRHPSISIRELSLYRKDGVHL
jgi:hypothetical protein